MKRKERSNSDMVTINLTMVKRELESALEKWGLCSPGPIYIDIVSLDPLEELEFEISIHAKIKRS